MIFRIRPHGITEMNIRAENPQEATDKYMERLNAQGFEIYQALGGTGKAGEEFEEAETGPSKIIRTHMLPKGPNFPSN